MLVSLTALIFSAMMRSAEIKYLWTFIFPFASLLFPSLSSSRGLPLCSLLGQCGLETVDGSAFLWPVSKHVPHYCVGVWKINMFAWDSRLSLCLSLWWLSWAVKLCEVWIRTKPAWCIMSLSSLQIWITWLSSCWVTLLHFQICSLWKKKIRHDCLQKIRIVHLKFWRKDGVYET